VRGEEMVVEKEEVESETKIEACHTISDSLETHVPLR